MIKAIFLDRDGTINAENYYLHKIEEFEFLPGVLEGLKILQDAGYQLIVITNQSGIARGYYSEEDFLLLNNWMIQTLETQGVYIKKVYYCPHLPNAKIKRYRMVCTCRKPLLGMFEKAIQEFQIDVNQSWVIGDKIRDCELCRNTNCRGFLIGNNESVEVIEAVKACRYHNVRYAINLLESVKIIVNMEEVK